MADLFPDIRLFDELEFLRFSDDQFASEMDCPENDDPKLMSLFAATSSKAGSDAEGSAESVALHTLSELKGAVASCTVGIYHSPETEESNFHVDFQERTLNELIIDIGNKGMFDTSSKASNHFEEAAVTSPVSFSAACERSPDKMSPKEIQSSDVTQTASPGQPEAAVQGAAKRRILEVLCITSGSGSKTPDSNGLVALAGGHRVAKRKRSFISEDDLVPGQFKTTKKTKRYQEKPFDDPEMERSRLNAINAKINRDRKKQEAQSLNWRCDNLSTENKELNKTNRNLEVRLQAAEEEIAFLQRALLGRVNPGLDDALKSVFSGNSAPAGG